MTARRAQLLFALFVSLSCAACAMSSEPLSNEDNAFVDDRLFGTWTVVPSKRRGDSSKDEAFVHIGMKGNANRTLRLVGAGLVGQGLRRELQDGSADAFVTVREHHYLSLRVTDYSPRNPGDDEAAACGYIIFRYSLPDADTIHLTFMDFDYVKSAIGNRQLKGTIGTRTAAAALERKLPLPFELLVAALSKPAEERQPVVAPKPWEDVHLDQYVATIKESPRMLLQFLEANPDKCFSSSPDSTIVLKRVSK